MNEQFSQNRFIETSFNKQIYKETRYANGFPETETPAYWCKKVFEISRNLSIDDWREIRTESYYQTRDELSIRILNNCDFTNSIHLNIQLYRFIYNSIYTYLNKTE
jgi:hypothetical protein